LEGLADLADFDGAAALVLCVRRWRLGDPMGFSRANAMVGRM
jgi:hypothetical protein